VGVAAVADKGRGTEAVVVSYETSGGCGEGETLVRAGAGGHGVLNEIIQEEGAGYYLKDVD